MEVESFLTHRIHQDSIEEMHRSIPNSTKTRSFFKFVLIYPPDRAKYLLSLSDFVHPKNSIKDFMD